MKTIEEKFRTVIEKNTFYFFNTEFAETYEGYLVTLKESLLLLKNDVETKCSNNITWTQFLSDLLTDLVGMPDKTI